MTHTDDTTRLLARIEGYRDEMVALQRDLTAVVALGPDNGGDGEWRRAEFIKERARSFGLDDVTELHAPDLRVPAGLRPNLLFRVRGRAERPTVWVMAHMDTVPPGELSLWDGDPYAAVVKDGTIVGRGVEDNQQGLTSGLFALRALVEEAVAPTTDVCLLLVSDEETGNAYGIEHVLAAAPDLFDPEDLVIVPDAGSPEGALLEVAEKCTLWVRFVVRGRQVHASIPAAGINAHRGSATLAVRLDARLHEAFSDEDPLFEPPVSTFEPTKREANVPNVNTIPGEDVFYFDCRLLPAHAIDEVKSVVAEVVREVESELGVKIDIGYPAELPAAPPTAPDSPVVEALSHAIRELRGLTPYPIGIGGGTVAAVFRRRGLPAVVWATLEETAHSPNEYCRIDNLVADAKVFGRVFVRGE
ncbi:MAG: M20 family metallo-hydrolase [Actinobacteria bacterium]|nr:M20 family metallo-hydrolase [Actinomycetota bacterium]